MSCAPDRIMTFLLAADRKGAEKIDGYGLEGLSYKKRLDEQGLFSPEQTIDLGMTL